MFRRRSVLLISVAVLGILTIAAVLYAVLSAESLYDHSFDTSVRSPAYTDEQHPRLLFDEAHRNYHTARGHYKPLVDLLAHDGYRIERTWAPFTDESLRGHQALISVCAKGSNDANDASAFTDAEVATVERWVGAGGSLRLITDHYPFGSAAASLGAAFGVQMSKGIVEDAGHCEPTRDSSHLVFTRDNGLLLDHPISRGRNAQEQVRRVLTFTGQSLQGPPGSTPFLILADTAMDRPASARVEKSGSNTRVLVEYGEPVSAKGRAQGVAFEFGKGRVVILGEAGMLSAQRDRRGQPVGMNYPGYDNRQLALNIMHWLTRLL